MKTILTILVSLALAGMAVAFKMRGKGENTPSVQSAFEGRYYVRSTPSEDYGTAGKTQVFEVGRQGDKLLDEYPVYMRGELFLGWSPIKGKWCLVHLEPERITSEMDSEKLGKVSRLAFYMGGTGLESYTGEELKKRGLANHVSNLAGRQADSFLVHGIVQIPRTNEYVFTLERPAGRAGTEKISWDITTGKIVGDAESK